MMNIVRTFLSGLVLNLFVLTLPAMAQETPTEAWDAALRTYVQDPDAQTGLARFDYGALKADSESVAALKAYIKSLEDGDPDILTDDEAVAYWANLYNAITVKLIVDNYPLTSIRKIKSGPFSMGPWGKKLITVKGKKLSLDNVEHDILRKKYPSPMIHYMVNCASIGCPNLKDGLWRADTLEADQIAAAKAFISSPRGVAVTDKGLTVSSIYKWFDEDFDGYKDGVLAHIRQYAEENLLAKLDDGLTIRGHDYNWSLNDIEQ